MKLAASITRSLQANMRAELRDIERAVAAGTRDAGRGLRTELRRQVASAGLGQRLANSWRDRHYLNQKLDAASLVYTKASPDHPRLRRGRRHPKQARAFSRATGRLAAGATRRHGRLTTLSAAA